MMNFAPFTHVPRMPIEPFSLLPTIALAAVAAGLHVVGLVGFRRRDIGRGPRPRITQNRRTLLPGMPTLGHSNAERARDGVRLKG